jgi:MinD superfamily P-loop ATPase
MFEIVILSGKGGTGKTSLTAAFAHLASNQVMCDLDVDAPDLHLLLQPRSVKTEKFISGHEAVIIEDKCEICGLCIDNCHYGAISLNGRYPVVNPIKCEGCKVCVAFCPAEAIDFRPKLCGEWYQSNTRFGWMIHAQLYPGEENSGRLVALLRQQANELALKHHLNMILSDGPPGIGCPVISSLSGASLAVIVTEPTPSGIHDLERVLELCGHFRVPSGVIVNKFDLNQGQTDWIERYCHKNGIFFLGKLPFDPVITQAMIKGQTITEYHQGEFSDGVKKIWSEIVGIADIRAAA